MPKRCYKGKYNYIKRKHTQKRFVLYSTGFLLVMFTAVILTRSVLLSTKQTTQQQDIQAQVSERTFENNPPAVGTNRQPASDSASDSTPASEDKNLADTLDDVASFNFLELDQGREKKNKPSQTKPNSLSEGINIFPKKLQGPKAQVKIHCLCPEGTKVRLTIIGKAGQILGMPSYMNKMEWSEKEKTLNLRAMGLKDGAYTFYVTARRWEKFEGLFLGRKNKQFKKRLERHRKQTSYQQQREKQELFLLTRDMHSLAQDFFKNTETQPGSYLKRWKELQSYKTTVARKSTVKTLSFSQLWRSYGYYHRKLGRQIRRSQKVQVQNKYQRRQLASLKKQSSFVYKLEQLHQRVGNLSVRR